MAGCAKQGKAEKGSAPYNEQRFLRSGMGYAVEVFSLDTESADAVAWQSSPNGKWDKVVWTDQSYRYVFHNPIAAQFFFVRIRRIAEASEPVVVPE